MSTFLVSKLDAVNQCLAAVGSLPVNSLDAEDLPADAAQALQVVEKVIREVQAEGWHWNTYRGITLSRDENGKIPSPQNAISVDVSPLYNPCIDPVVRGSFLFDTLNSTDVFDADLTKCEIVYHLTWDNLPQEPRQYIAATAALEYGTGTGLITYSKEQELIKQARTARTTMVRLENIKSDLTMFASVSGNRIFNTLYRRRY